MSDAKYELWDGRYIHQGKEVGVLVLTKEGEQGFLTLYPENIQELVQEGATQEGQGYAALQLAITYELVSVSADLWHVPWTDILDRKLVAEFSLDGEHMAATMEEFFQDYPDHRPTPPTLH